MDWYSLFIENVILWILIVIGDGFVFTVFYRKMTGKWWWKKETQKPYEIVISAEGWSISGSGHNPIQTISTAINHMFGLDKPPAERIEAIIRKQVDAEVSRMISNDETLIRQLAEEEVERMRAKILKNMKEVQK